MNRDDELKKIFSGKYPGPLDFVTKKSYKILLFRSEIDCGTIEDITLPEIPNNYSVFNFKDLPNNYIEIEGDNIPILSENKVEYKGQPILIIVGPEIDKLQKIKKEIKVHYRATIPKKEILYKKAIKNIDPSEKYKSLAGNISTGDVEHRDKFCDGVFIKKDSENLVIYSYNNWDKVLIKNIEKYSNINRNNIKIVTPFIECDEFTSSFDTLYSSIISVVTHLLIKKNVYFESPINERKDYFSKQYGVNSNWKLHYDRNNEIIGCEIKVQMDAGAFPVLIKEKVSRMLFGITSYYKIRNVNIEVEVIKSHNPPCGIFTGLYLPEAIFICETLVTKVANLLNLNQFQFRYENILEKGYKSNTNRIIKKELSVKEMLLECVKESDFLRKDTSISLIHRRRGSVLKMLPKKGVGLSLGYCGNSYISNSKGLMQNSVTVDLLQGNIVDVKINSTVNSLGFLDLWKGIVTEVLDIPMENITISRNERFTEQSPLIENKNINIITPLLEQCCSDIKKRRFKDPLPISQTRFTRRASVRSWDVDKWEGEPFKNPSMGCIILETIIDKRSLEPKINEIWIKVDVGEIINRDILIKSIKKDILSSLGSLLNRPGKISLPPINIGFYDGGRGKRDSKAMGAMIYSMLPGAYLQSINRALGSNFSSLPVTREMISKELLKVDI